MFSMMMMMMAVKNDEWTHWGIWCGRLRYDRSFPAQQRHNVPDGRFRRMRRVAGWKRFVSFRPTHAAARARRSSSSTRHHLSSSATGAARNLGQNIRLHLPAPAHEDGRGGRKLRRKVSDVGRRSARVEGRDDVAEQEIVDQVSVRSGRVETQVYLMNQLCLIESKHLFEKWTRTKYVFQTLKEQQ